MHLYGPVVVGVVDVGHYGAVSGGFPRPCSSPTGTGDENQLAGSTGGADTVDTGLHHG